MKPRLTLLVTILALCLAALAPAATSKSSSKSFKGKAANAGTVKFRLAGSKVKGFLLSHVYLSCSSSSYSGIRAGGPVPSIRVRRGKFSYDDRPTGDTGTRITVKGKIKGSKASGTVKVSDAGYDASAQTTYFCTSTERKWTAKTRKKR